ncbi:MAG: hypothetical protein IKK82_12370 [Kiritimatiellae bacterium]|nr:hypothetical protein [Kiritimatiellia bacterium]
MDKMVLFFAGIVSVLPAFAIFIEKPFSVPEGDYRYVDGAGWEGRRAIVFRSETPCRGKCPFVALDLAPGYQYEFTAIVQSRLSEDSVVELSLSWFDSLGKRISSATGKPMNDNEVLPDGWVRYGAKTPIIPANAVRGAMHVYVCHGGKGRAVFDRFTLKQLDAKWVGPLLSSAYQNVAVDGTVRFAVPLMHFEALRIPKGELCATFTMKGADGKPFSLPPSCIDGRHAEVSVDVSRLAKGSNPVVFELKTTKRSYGISKCTFTRADALPERKVWIDSKKRLIVDGKPFFMLGMYWRKITDKELDVFCPSPFNTVLPCQRPVRAQFDLCQKRGLKMCYPFENLYDVPGEETNVVRIVKELKDHQRSFCGI